MDTRPLGSTGLLASRMGLGLAALGRPGYINLGRASDLGDGRSVTAMERRCHQVLDAASAAGVRYVDAARSYGLAERFLASWLHARAVSPGALVIGSKWGYTYRGAWRLDAPVHEVKDLSLETLERQLAESRGTLDGFLSLYQIHSATLESRVLENPSVLARLGELRIDGLVIGLTVSGPSQRDVIRQALEVHVDGRPLFQVVQATWNLLEVSAGQALADAHAAGRGIVVKEALANGRLTDRAAEPELGALRHEASSRGLPMDVLALSAALSQPWADVVLSGAVTSAQLKSNLSALGTEVRPEELPTVAMAPHEYWLRRSTLVWA